MAEFVKAITDILSGVFTALVNALGSIGNIVFSTSEAGAITGLSPFGTLLAVGIGLPLATWAFGKFFSFIRGIGRGNR